MDNLIKGLLIMRSSDGKYIHPLVSAAFAVAFAVCVFFIGFSFFDVDKRMSYADFDAGSAGIAASSFFAIGLSFIAFHKARRLLFFVSLSMVALLVWFFYFYAIRETIRLGEYYAEFNWLFVSFIPCAIALVKGVKEGWFRASSNER